jgi:VanZ family protein
MLPLRHARRWQAASVVLLFMVLVAALIPAAWFWPDRRQFVTWFVGADKWLHGITFVFLAVWFSGQYRPRSYWRIGLSLIFFGVLIEACQRLVAYRLAELLDIVADAAGIVVGLTVAMVGLGGWSLRMEDWYAKRRADNGID